MTLFLALGFNSWLVVKRLDPAHLEFRVRGRYDLVARLQRYGLLWFFMSTVLAILLDLWWMFGITP